jgi:hypothetical protein
VLCPSHRKDCPPKIGKEEMGSDLNRGGEKGGTKRGTEKGGKKKRKLTDLLLMHCWLLRLPQTNNRGEERSLLCSTGGFGSGLSRLYDEQAGKQKRARDCVGVCFSLGVRQRWIGGVENESRTQCDAAGEGGYLGIGYAARLRDSKTPPPPNPPRKQISRWCPAKASIPGGFAPFPRPAVRPAALCFFFFFFLFLPHCKQAESWRQAGALTPCRRTQRRLTKPLYLFLLVE